MTGARSLAADRDAPASERYAALWTLLSEAPDAHLDLAASVADEPLGALEAWTVPLQGIALVTLFARDPARWCARLDAVARAAPGTWIFDALDDVTVVTVRPLLEWLAATATPHVAHPALARLLSDPWEGRGAWALRALRDPERDVQVIALEAAPRFGDDEALALATMLADPSADARLVAAEALAAVPCETARAVLQQHLAHERSARVRRVILETHGVVAQAEVAPDAPVPEGGPAALTQRAEATVTALAKPVAPWFKVRPTLHWDDGSEAPASVGEYLLFCQHARVGAELDERSLEGAALLERASLAQWSVALVEAWVAKRADVKHHWCLTLAVALGGDLIVPVVQREIAQWHRGGRRALAAQGARLLAYVGGDRAMRALDEIARAHGYDALGSLAASALAAEAEARGVSREELSDAIVPRWGLNAEGRGWLDYGRRRVRVALEPSEANLLDATLVDGEERALAAPPKPTRADDPVRAAEALARWKSLKHELPSVVSAEARRFEEALCTGRAWSLAAWRSLVLGHPVLRALAERLVWCVSAAGQSPTFARVARGELVGERGEPLPLSASVALVIAHPVALDADARLRWQRVLEAAGVEAQPFAQLARTVHLVAESDAEDTAWKALEGATLRAVSDRSRVRQTAWARAGWEPAPIEGGVCRVFLRRYGSVDAVLEVEGIALWAEAMRETAVCALRFRDAHGDGSWKRLGAVPPTIVSEAVRAALHMLDGGDDPDRAMGAGAGRRRSLRPRP